jgi:hypothetical protein
LTKGNYLFCIDEMTLNMLKDFVEIIIE